ncbi:TonB-dependent receptor [Methylophilus methylotrophus]|uniref:TonB-dependent receptor n=1 Tax=Methylophilus methylotrophus TaxID=17 RepID=UPI000F59E873|nr:TonB-dependent receptor [Methylophilus methylotrophus]
MFNKKIKSALLLATYSYMAVAADADDNATKNQEPEKTIELEEVEVKAKRRRIITPLPGVPIDRETATTNIQSATAKEIEETKALNVTEFMNGNMQSVTTNDYAGNPFQQDLNFRGFTASPSIGTPQGISVYMDGVRINEAFGEVVNWDLIPMNAISSLNMIPGSNPLFGLNTIGGALAIRTKDGFSDNYLRSQYLTGSWGREQFQLSNGIHSDNFALFTAYNHFKEDGWRDSSPSNVRQLFNKATLRFDKAELTFTALNVDTALVGNGMIPFEMAEQDRSQVFTSPDEVKNSLEHFNLSGSWYVNDNITLSGLVYKRNVKQTGVGADVYDAYRRLVTAWSAVIGPASRINGLFNYTDLDQSNEGFTLQSAFDFDKHQIVLGFSLDRNDVDFLQSQQLGEINDADHSTSLVTNPIFGVRGFFPAYMTIDRNDLKGTSQTKSAFIFDQWSINDNLQLSLGGRLNWSNVKNTLRSDTGKEFYNFTSSDLLPERQVCLIPGDVSPTRGRFVCSEGDYDYRSFNPSLGVNWDLKEAMSAYANISRGARTPTVIELGCANDKTKSNAIGSTNFQYGCSIPTSLSSDPYLKQVRSTSYETGLRGQNGGFEWNIGVFRTELKDDILFVPLGRRNRGVFDNFGATLRQGMEMGLKGSFDNDKFSLNYTWMKATFESSSRIVNDANSSNGATVAANAAQAFVNVEPGDQLPGMPNHIIQANWNHRFNEKFDATLSMVMHSSSFVRGNENNDHEPRPASNVTVGGTNRDPYDYIGEGYIPGYAVFNLRANYKWRPGVNMFIKIDNIFDRDYSTAGVLGRNPFNSSGQFQTNVADWNNTTFIGPGAPRSAWVGISIDWDWKNKSLRD